MKRNKVTVIGAGNVGGTTVQRLAEKELGDVVLLDVSGDMARGKALDILQSAPIYGYDTKITGTDDYSETKGSDLIIVTAGIARRPGMSRDDLLKTNAGIIKDVVKSAVSTSPDAIIIVVTNPLDVMTYVAYKVSGFRKERVMGMAGLLDSARLAAFISMELSVSSKDISAMVLGGHGDSMVPSARYTTVAGIPVSELLPGERLDAITKRTREGGAEIVNLLKAGSAYYAPSAAVAEMAETIMKDKKKIIPCSVLCKGKYGIDGVFVGLPARLGIKGVEEILEIDLTPDESSALKRSSNAVSELCRLVDGMI
jgi:malate dehydrogenase